MTQMTALRRRMIDDLTVCTSRPATRQPRLDAVASFGRFFGRSPNRLSAGEVRAYQFHLAGLDRRAAQRHQFDGGLKARPRAGT
jgi:hypothetical protein